MDRILILSAGLLHTHLDVLPFIYTLRKFLRKECFADIHDTTSFEVEMLEFYDTVVIVYPIAMNNVPSSLLKIMKSWDKKDMSIYTIACCDEYESNHCTFSNRVIENWCRQKELNYKGTLNIGSYYLIDSKLTHYTLVNKIKSLSEAIVHQKDIFLEVSLLSKKAFIQSGNRYWKKEIKNHRKES